MVKYPAVADGSHLMLTKFQMPLKKPRMGVFTALAIRNNASMEIIFSPRSQFPDQVTDFYVQRSGNFQQRCKRGFHISPFHFPNEIVVQISLFRQFLLRQMSLLPVMADFFTQYTAMLRFRWHSIVTRTGTATTLHTV
jgi:hypothetical protein